MESACMRGRCPEEGSQSRCLSCHLDFVAPKKSCFTNATPSIQRSKFLVAVHRETGHTLHDYVTERRIRRAKELLKHSELNVGEIAERFGYRTIFQSRVQTARFAAPPRVPEPALSSASASAPYSLPEFSKID